MEEAFKATGGKSGSISVSIDLYDGNYQQALDRLISSSRDTKTQFYFRPLALRIALIYRFMGNNQKAKEYYEQAIDILKTKIAEDPNDPRYYSSIGIAYAGLGRQEDAVKYGKLGVEILPVSKEAMKGPFRLQDIALIYVMLGKYDEAMGEIEYLLSIPCTLSPSILKFSPDWKPLRNHPRFQKLIESDK